MRARSVLETGAQRCRLAAADRPLPHANVAGSEGHDCLDGAMARTLHAHLSAALWVAVLLFAAPPGALAEETSGWSSAHGGAMRLIPGAAMPGGRGAGVEIRLDPGWKTYWRDPGDAGVPPVFDWSRSDNLAKVTLSWPAPTRFDDEAGSSIGYKHDVVFPLAVVAKDPAKPVTLA